MIVSYSEEKTCIYFLYGIILPHFPVAECAVRPQNVSDENLFLLLSL